jgi:hypothetical protein
VTIEFSFVNDEVSNAFLTEQRRGTILSAGVYVGSRLTDELAAIPSGNFTGTAFYPGMPGGGQAQVTSVPADTLVVFVGANDTLLGTTLAVGGPGGVSAGGTAASVALAKHRGQDPRTDFGPWGGSISFNPDFTWYADPDPSTTEPFAGFDLFSVAIHELGHLLGFGTAESWVSQVSAGKFAGPTAQGVHGGPVPLADSYHWADGTRGPLLGLLQEAALDPTITPGTRKYYTDLDWAGLADIGWQVAPASSVGEVPLPASVVLLGTALLALFGLRRRDHRTG